ncbi:hypothetical protein [Nakamurella sp.]|uniref:hypothetical protein n=1 Tax=Nakamurella sp. TaxID=1869182 RepID=UPI00378515DA
MGEDVFLAIGRSVPDSPEFAQNLADLELPCMIFEGPLTRALIADLAIDIRADLVVVPHGDELAARLGGAVRSLPSRTVALIMRDPRWERPAPLRRRTKNMVKLALLFAAGRRRNVDVVWLRHYGYSGPGRYAIDPFILDGTLDDVEAAGLAVRDNLLVGSNTFWFVVTGAITDRKNVRMIAGAISEVQRTSPERQFGLALIGPHRTTYPIDRESVRAMSGFRCPVVSEDRLLSNFEMNAVVASADAVVMAYDTHSPNSTMLKARALGTRLVVAGPPSIRSFALDMGFTIVSCLTLENLAQAMRTVALSPAPASCPAVPDGVEFARALLAGR